MGRLIEIIKRNKFYLLIALVVFIVFLPSLFGDFVWDDEEQVVNNPIVHSLENITELFKGSTFNSGGSAKAGGIYYKPMMSFFFTLLYSVFNSDSFYFHLFQLSIHIVNSCLVFYLFRHFFIRFKFWERNKSKKKDSTNPLIMPFLIALLFSIHPINVESVVYISALQDVLFFFFGMLAFWLLMRSQVQNLDSRRKNLILMFLVSLLILLSILSKETGFLFLPIIFIYLLFFNRKKVKIFSIFILGVVGIYSILRFIVAKVYFVSSDLSPIMRLSLVERILNIPKIILFYFRTFLFPKDLAIAQHWTLESLNFSNFLLPLIFVMMFVISVVWFGLRLKKEKQIFKVYIFFVTWFLVGLGLHLQIVALDMTVAERWFYFPIVGLLGIVGVIIKAEIVDLKKVIFILIPILLILSIRSFARTLDWKDGLTLYGHDINLSKDAFDLENNYGVELFRDGNSREAKIHFEKSTELAPYWWTNWNNLGAIYSRQGDLSKAEEYYKKAIDNGDYYLAYENYVGVLINQGKIDEAHDFLEKDALLKFPNNKKLREYYYYLLLYKEQD